VTAWEYHRNNSQGKECSHYCFPSAPQLWVWTFKKALDAHPPQPLQQLQQPANSTKKKRKRDVRGCATVLDREEGMIGPPKPKHAVVEDVPKNEQQQPWQQPAGSSGNAEQQQQQQQQPGDSSSVRVPTAQLQYMQAALQRLHNQNKYLLQLLRQRRRQHQQRQQQQQQARLPAEPPGSGM
jgi:hypothetical protein